MYTIEAFLRSVVVVVVVVVNNTITTTGFDLFRHVKY